MRMDVRTILHDLPDDVRGFMTTDEYAEPVVVLNRRDTLEMHRETYLHEIVHYENGDLYCIESADEIEAQAHA